MQARNSNPKAMTQLACIEYASRQDLRQALVEVGGNLGWDELAVSRIAEAITGRAWDTCTGSDIVHVARVLVEIAGALRQGCRQHAELDRPVRRQ
jgi:hypothetical protein